MNFEALKINCLGASNTEITKSENNEVIRQINYPALLQERLHCIVRNYGVGGTNIAKSDSGRDSYVERMTAMDPDADVILFQGNGNDAAHDIPLGMPEDTDPTTFCGAIRTVLSYLRSAYPEAKIIALSGMGKNRPLAREDKKTHEDFQNTFMETCRICGVTAHDFSIDPEICVNNPKHMPDGLHMSVSACRHYAEVVEKLIRSAFR